MARKLKSSRRSSGRSRRSHSRRSSRRKVTAEKRCRCMTDKGTRCRRKAMRGSDVCKQHRHCKTVVRSRSPVKRLMSRFRSWFS